MAETGRVPSAEDALVLLQAVRQRRQSIMAIWEFMPFTPEVRHEVEALTRWEARLMDDHRLAVSQEVRDA